MKKILIVGATSAIAKEFARLYASQAEFYLVGRNQEQLELLSSDLKTRGAVRCNYCISDALEFDQHAEIIKKARNELTKIDIALVAHGYLGDQTRAEYEFSELLKISQTNYTGVVTYLSAIANCLQEQKYGTLLAISSVAGDRGRKSNYIYGSAKAALATFLSGLRNRLSRFGVHVITVKPGFVDTPMTKDFKKGILWVQPLCIAKGMQKAIEKKSNSIYLPGVWRLIMMIIRNIPEAIFKKMSL